MLIKALGMNRKPADSIFHLTHRSQWSTSNGKFWETASPAEGYMTNQYLGVSKEI